MITNTEFEMFTKQTINKIMKTALSCTVYETKAVINVIMTLVNA